jgi:hypothetical protein
MKGLSIKLKWKPNSPADCGRKWFKAGFPRLGLIRIGIVTFSSPRSSPAVGTARWVPSITGNWANWQGRFYNFPACEVPGFPIFMIASNLWQKILNIGLKQKTAR